jgi:hypothetical protein
MRSFGTQTEKASKDAWVQTSTCEEEEEEEEEEAEEKNLTSEDEDENTHMSDEEENEEEEPPSEEIEESSSACGESQHEAQSDNVCPVHQLSPEELARQDGCYVLQAYNRDIQRTPRPAGYKKDQSWSPVKYP